MAATYTVYLSVGTPDLDAATECPGCGFDSLLAFPLHTLSVYGVGTIGTFNACPRCYEGDE